MGFVRGRWWVDLTCGLAGCCHNMSRTQMTFIHRSPVGTISFLFSSFLFSSSFFSPLFLHLSSMNPHSCTVYNNAMVYLMSDCILPTTLSLCVRYTYTSLCNQWFNPILLACSTHAGSQTLHSGIHTHYCICIFHTRIWCITNTPSPHPFFQ